MEEETCKLEYTCVGAVAGGKNSVVDVNVEFCKLALVSDACIPGSEVSVISEAEICKLGFSFVVCIRGDSEASILSDEEACKLGVVSVMDVSSVTGVSVRDTAAGSDEPGLTEAEVTINCGGSPVEAIDCVANASVTTLGLELNTGHS